MTSTRRGPMPAHPLTVAICLLAAAVVFAPLQARAATEGADSPQGVVDGLRVAGEAKDFAGIARLLEPESRAEMTVSLIIGTTMMVAFAQMGGELVGGMGEAFAVEEESAEAKAERERQQAEAEKVGAELQERLEAVFAKYGVDETMGDGMEVDDEAGPEALVAALDGVDQPALIGELLGIMSSLGDGGEDDMTSMPMGELENLEIEGDRATGTVNSEPAEFVRIDGRWYFAPPDAGF